MAAPLMSATETYNMTPSRFGVPLRVLTNKRAADQAFQQHVWTMQQKAADAAAGVQQQHVAGQYRLKEQEMQNQVLRKSGIEATTLAQAVQIAKNQGIDVETPEGQQQLGQIYQYLLQLQQSGGTADTGIGAGAANLATGGSAPMATEDKTSVDFPGFLGGWQQGAAARPSASKAVKSPVSSTPSAPGGRITATNPKTGQKMEWKNGSWQPI